ncbi:MAG: signal recognition particle protein [Alphaproteobacteria bacterium]
MFDSLTDRLGEVFGKLTRRGRLSESDVTSALREIRVALLEADVALPVVKALIEDVREKAVGEDVLRSVTPGQMVIKLVHDQLVAMLGAEAAAINLRANPPVAILMVGLQGSGKTTTTAKLARRLSESERKKVLMASLDVYRPAAQEQLKTLGQQTGIATLPIVAGEMPLAIARRAMEAGRLQGFDVVLLDTAGRLAIDENLMNELEQVKATTSPAETLLVADSMTGQDAVATARTFNERVGLSGIVLTRVDGDARGGAALSMRWVTGQPIKFLGTGEKTDALEVFHPDRIAGRILGQGDVVSLVEKASQSVTQEEAERIARKATKGRMDLDDFLQQLRQVQKMGGLSGVLKMLPGAGSLKKQMPGGLDEAALRRQEAIIQSMTRDERRRPGLIKASRKKRIAAGSGTSVQDVNKLLKQFDQMNTMMKRVGKMSKKGQLPPGDLPGLPPGLLGR